MVPEYSNLDARPLRVGVVGASGWASLSHLPALTGTSGLALTAVATSRETSARETARRWGVPAWFTSAAALAACEDVDLITVSVKAPLHREVVEQVLAAGKPILCEWPLGGFTDRAEYLASTVASAGVRGFVGLQAVADPVLRRVGERVAAGAIGTVLCVTVRASRAFRDPVPPSSVYTLDVRDGAGTLEIVGGHVLSALHTALGRDRQDGTQPLGGASDLAQPVHTSTDGGTVVATGPDLAVGLLDLHPGLGTLVLSDSPDPGTEITVTGTGGHVRARTLPADPIRFRQPQIAGWQAEVTVDGGTEHLAPDADPPLPLAARNPAAVYRMISSDLRAATTTAPTLDDAVALHRILDALRPPARDRRP